MTLIEILIFIANCIIGCVLGIHIYAKSGNLIFSVAGGVVGFLVGVLCILGLKKLADFWYGVFPLRPICRQGKCKSDDYEWNIELTRSRGADVFVCKCGDRYIRRHGHFDELLADGSTRPYMKHPFLLRTWQSS